MKISRNVSRAQIIAAVGESKTTAVVWETEKGLAICEPGLNLSLYPGGQLSLAEDESLWDPAPPPEVILVRGTEGLAATNVAREKHVLDASNRRRVTSNPSDKSMSADWKRIYSEIERRGNVQRNNRKRTSGQSRKSLDYPVHRGGSCSEIRPSALYLEDAVEKAIKFCHSAGAQSPSARIQVFGARHIRRLA